MTTQFSNFFQFNHRPPSALLRSPPDKRSWIPASTNITNFEAKTRICLLRFRLTISIATLGPAVISLFYSGIVCIRLRCQNKRRKRCNSRDWWSMIANRVLIDQRPAVVKHRTQGGDWERGANENTNRRIRQYFPNSGDVTTITPSQLARTVHQLNHRSQKCTGMKTPNQALSSIVPLVALLGSNLPTHTAGGRRRRFTLGYRRRAVFRPADGFLSITSQVPSP